MKPIFYIGIFCDEITQEISSDIIRLKFLELIGLFTEQSDSQGLRDLPYELTLLTRSSNAFGDKLISIASEIGLSIQQADRLDENQTWEDFLINKSNLIIVFEDISKTNSLKLSNKLISRIDEPEATLNTDHYHFSNHDEFIPYLYRVEIEESRSTSGFYRTHEEARFKIMIKQFTEISSELQDTKSKVAQSALSEKLSAIDKDKSTSFAQFYHAGCRFDLLANKHQKRSNLGFWILFSLSLILGASFLLYAKIFTNSPWLLIVYLFAYTLGLISYYRAKKRASLQKHLAYRLCAEVFRLKLFQLVSKSTEPKIPFQFENIISRQDAKTDWIAHMVRAFVNPRAKDLIDFSTSKDIIKTHLLDEQLQYFTVKLNGRKSSSGKLFQPSISGLKQLLSKLGVVEHFIIFISLLLLIIVTLTAFKVSFFYALYPIKNILMFLVGFLPIIGLAIEQVIFNFAWEENELRYHQQISRFHSIKKWVSATKEQQRLYLITNQLCIECVQENFNWYCTRVNRQHKPASGG